MKIVCPNCQNENDDSLKYCATCGFELPIIAKENSSTKVEELNAKPQPKKKFNSKSVMALIGFMTMFFITQYFLNPSVEKQLIKNVNEINKTCPLKVDQNTTLKSVAALPNRTVKYNYILIGVTKSEVNLDTVKKYVFPNLLQNVKNNPGMKIFKDNNVTIIYNYSDKNEENITEYIIKPEMYK